MQPILSLKNVSKSFGALTVVNGISLDVHEGAALGVIGPNGAGKSTLFNLIGGALPVSSGRILVDGTDATRLSASDRCRLGVARSFQIPRPFAGMTVYENLLVAAEFGGPRAPQSLGCREVLERTGLLHRANTRAQTLNLLERKRLELARALASGPRLLLLDEIAGGLTEAECRDLVATVRDVRQMGVSIIWIEHIVHALTAVVDRLVVIDFGAVVMEGEPHAVMKDPTVQELYMGICVNDEAA